MGNVFRVFARDVKRVAKVPAAWLVALFLIVLPSLYAWFNVIGFWNPYENTGNLRICVVNEDAGTHDEVLGDLDLGSQIVDQLKDNDQLGWDFVDRDQAMQAVESGDAYAAFVIPQDFSSDMATILTGDFTAPKLEYYVNEKTGPVAPKITDTGATTLDTTVRKMVIDNLPFLLADTVGFIRKLPTDLVDSFKSTLDEVREADLLLHVVDICHPDFEEQITVVENTLKDLGCAEKPSMLVFNKIDNYTWVDKEPDDLTPPTRENVTLDELRRTWMAKLGDDCIFISARERQNIDELRDAMYRRVRSQPASGRTSTSCATRCTAGCASFTCRNTRTTTSCMTTTSLE